MLVEARFEKELRKWGSSLGIVVPKNWLNILNAEEGDTVVFEIKAVKKQNQESGPKGIRTQYFSDHSDFFRFFDRKDFESIP